MSASHELDVLELAKAPAERLEEQPKTSALHMPSLELMTVKERLELARLGGSINQLTIELHPVTESASL